MPEIGVSSTADRRRVARRAAGAVPGAGRVRELIGGAGSTARRWRRERRRRGRAEPRRRARGPDSAELARRIAAIVDDKKGEEIVALDVRELVVLHRLPGDRDGAQRAPGEGDRRRGPLRLKREHGLLPARVEGEAEARWVLLDYLDCVLHVQVPEMRERYRLERLWGEAARLELELEGAAD